MMGFFNENYRLTIIFQYSRGEGGPNFQGVRLFPGGGSPIAYSYINL